MKNQPNARPFVAVMILSIVAIVAACTSDASARLAPPTEDDLATISRDAAYEQQRTALVDNFQQRYPGATVPALDMVRFVTPSDWAVTKAQCMTEAGYVAMAERDSVEFGGIPVDQEEAFDLAALECDLKYPMDPRYSSPLSDYQVQYLYEYYVLDLVPCLEASGIDVGDAPSLQRFRETFETAEGWTPYNAVNIDEALREWDALNARCPQAPADLFG